jgi:hypothetical protein
MFSSPLGSTIFISCASTEVAVPQTTAKTTSHNLVPLYNVFMEFPPSLDAHTSNSPKDCGVTGF